MIVRRDLPPVLRQISPPPWPEYEPAGAKDALLARALTLAKVGAWCCQLADNTLNWTSGVYDLFGFAIGEPLHRQQIVEMYAEESRDEMERLRARAVAQCGTFTLDAQITRTDGTTRWMRLTGQVTSDPFRRPLLHGLKQDITRDKLRWDAMRSLAENDQLTGLANRATYESRFLNKSRAFAPIAPLGALILFDLNEFKGVNDKFGHAAGDTCLRIFAERLAASFPDALLTARIGGDEFAMMVGPSEPSDPLPARVGRFLALLRAPIVWHGHIFSISASTGISEPIDPCFYDPEELFVRADARLYADKRARQQISATKRRPK